MILIVVLVAISLSILARLGVFRAAGILGPERLNPGESAIELLVLLVAAFLLTTLITVVYARFVHVTNPFITSAVLDGIGFTVLLLLNATIRHQGLARLGMTRQNLRKALVIAPVGLILLAPSVYLLDVAITLLLQHLGKPLPMHPFLKLIQKSHDPKQIALLFLSASIVAPLAEELLFRGHVQTLLSRAFLGLKRRPITAIPPAFAMEPAALPVLDYASPDANHLPRTVRARWLAVIVTSILFALVHEQIAFMPPLFVLAMGLGYVYERTGNLWACVGIHSLFNTIEVILFLSIRQ